MTSPPYLNSFNAIRFIAAVHIVNGHFFQQTFMAHSLPAGLTVLLSSSASYSTSLFFVLSGFVLAYARQRRVYKNKPTERPIPLFARHLKRVAPYLIVGSALALALELKKYGIKLDFLLQFLFSISLIPPFLLGLPTINPPAWALSVFVLGYLVDAFYGSKLASKSIKKRLLLTLFVVGLLYFLAFLLGILIPDSPPYPPRTHAFGYTAVHIFPLFRIFEVILGMLLGSLVHERFFQIKRVIGSLPMMPEKLITVIVLLFNLACLSFISKVSGKMAFLATHGLLLAPQCLMLIALAVCDNWAPRLKLEGLFSLLGRLSLPIYLLHQPGYSLYGGFLRLTGVDLAPQSWIYMFGYFFFLVVLTLMIMAFIEHIFALSSR